MVWRTIRAMMKHKTPRCQAALDRLKVKEQEGESRRERAGGREPEAHESPQVFDGVPPPYDKVKRMVMPDALRVLRLRPGRKYTNLGRMCSEVGWKHRDTVLELEEKRKVKGAAYWAKKKEAIKVC